ncbi:MAG: hypothetical protein RsTaC01_0693 [Candidatus Paraimprobicoccus trichonymphae]|uniref:Uncharacterized protein n=1 Tax=Candidatus Paraimprobicoccus trichonymphae TaxID=3033793 RepID=A0AA48HWR8_9FIRM|nr:MAG: hypothetical protein RsTaC01_0693 [Candidatus Paraimprobicoccus trichonymphae]
MTNNEELINILKDVDKLKELTNAEKKFGIQGVKNIVSKFGLEISLEEITRIVEALKNAIKIAHKTQEELVENLENVPNITAEKFLKSDIIQNTDNLEKLVSASSVQEAKDMISKFGLEISLGETSKVVEILQNAIENAQEAQKELVEDLENVAGGIAGKFLENNAWNIANSVFIVAATDVEKN